MNNVSHKNIWRTGAVKLFVEPSLIPLMKINNDTKVENLVQKLNGVESLRQKSRICKSLKWPCLITVISSSSCC